MDGPGGLVDFGGLFSFVSVVCSFGFLLGRGARFSLCSPCAFFSSFFFSVPFSAGSTPVASTWAGAAAAVAVGAVFSFFGAAPITDLSVS